MISSFGNNPQIKRLISTVSDGRGKVHRVASLPGSSKTLLVHHLLTNFKKIMLLVPSVKDVLEISTELKLIGTKKPVIQISEFNSKQIQETLNNLSTLSGYCLVSTYELLLVKLPSRADFSENLYRFNSGEEMGYDKFVALLSSYNYRREKYVESPGHFAQRGAIIDFWSHSESLPVRVEFDGDFIESVRFFDPENQRSVQLVESATISPDLEEFSTNDENLFEDDIFDYVTDALIVAEEYYIREARFNEVKIALSDDEEFDQNATNGAKNQPTSSAGYATSAASNSGANSGNSGTVNGGENKSTSNANSSAADKKTKTTNKGKPNGAANGKVSDADDSYMDENDEAFNQLIENFQYLPTAREETEKKVKIAIEELLSKGGNTWLLEAGIKTEGDIPLDIASAPAINANYEILFSTLTGFPENGYSVTIAVENEIQQHRLKDLLVNKDDEFGLMIEDGTISFALMPLREGFSFKKEKLLVLSDYQIFGKPFRTKITTYKRAVKSRRNTLGTIKPGDFVVHEEYGIGRFAGLHTVKIGEIEQESVKLLFGEGGAVFVNLNYLQLIKKYSSKEGVEPKVSVLGTNTWENTKARAKRKIREIARDLIELYARRKATQGFSFSHDTQWQKELEASFIYEETPDQLKVTEEVKKDMEDKSPMDRLVCGDVGFGKTEVAIRAAFKAVQENKQVGVLVPTTILAEQHYNTFRDRLSQFPVRVEVLSRFRTKALQKEIVDDLKLGKIDLIIGTHRLISKDIEFKDLGLLIIDEEHRFGVKAKEKLRSMRVNVDTLTLTATPIPRTLNFSLHGARDLSIMATPPANRQPIYTKVGLFDIRSIREWLLAEFERNGQVYIVHDRILSINKLGDYIKKFVPEAVIGVAHGRMTPDQLEDVIHGFLQKKFNVLLSTKIIESGIDIPNVNTIIVNRADRFGLAELHQLRGRVGRSNRQAYAYFLVPSLTALRQQTLKRLKAIEEFNELGSGFNLAMRDLEIRGAGNLLGTEQSGFITDVGFDLYMKLVNEAVEELKHQEFKEVFRHLAETTMRTDPKIDTFYEIGIPEHFMPDQSDRLNFYTSLISAGTMKEIDDIKDELSDRFGLIPQTARRLIEAARIRYYASFALFDRIIIQRKRILLILPPKEREEFYENHFKVLLHFVMTQLKNSVRFDQQRDSMKLIIESEFESPEKIAEYLTELLRKITELYKVKNVEEENGAVA